MCLYSRPFQYCSTTICHLPPRPTHRDHRDRIPRTLHALFPHVRRPCTLVSSLYSALIARSNCTSSQLDDARCSGYRQLITEIKLKNYKREIKQTLMYLIYIIDIGTLFNCFDEHRALIAERRAHIFHEQQKMQIRAHNLHRKIISYKGVTNKRHRYKICINT